MRREYPSRKTSSAEGGVGLPVTALPVDVTVGTGPILEEDEAIKAGLVGPFPISDEGDSRISVSNAMVEGTQSLRGVEVGSSVRSRR